MDRVAFVMRILYTANSVRSIASCLGVLGLSCMSGSVVCSVHIRVMGCGLQESGVVEGWLCQAIFRFILAYRLDRFAGRVFGTTIIQPLGWEMVTAEVLGPRFLF